MATKVTVAELLVDIGLDTDDAVAAAKKFDKRMASTIKTAKSLTAGAKELAKGLAVFTAAATAAALGVFKLVDSITTAGDEIGKAAKQFGTSTKELQEMRFAAEASGASADSLTMALKNQAKFMEEASTGAVTPFTQTLQAVGIQLNDIAALKSPQERFGMIGEALKNVDDEAQRVAFAMKLVGEESGPRLIPFLLEGREGLAALGEQAQSLGVVMGEDAVAASEAFQGSVQNAKATVTGIATVLGTELIPIVDKALKRFVEWTKANKDLIRVRVEAFVQRVTDAVEKLTPLFERLAEVVLLLVENFDTLAALFVGGKLISGFFAAASGLRAMGFAASGALGPLGLLLGTLVAITPAAIAAARALTDSRLKTLEDKSGFTPGSAADVETGKEQDAILAAGAQIRGDLEQIAKIQRISGQTSGGSIDKFRQRIDMNVAKIKTLQARGGAEASEGEMFDGGPLTQGPALPGLGETSLVDANRVSKTGKKKKKDTLSIFSVQDLIDAAAGGDLSDIAGATPSVREIEPTVAVDITNNNWTFNNKQTITGVTDPVKAGQESVRQFDQQFQRKMTEAGQRVAKGAVI
jgi:hypothetical protein